MKKSIQLLTILFVTALLTSCNASMFNSVSGNRNVVTDNRTPKEDFIKIKVSSGLDLFITQGNTTEVILEADENLHEIIFTEVNNGELRIYSEKSIWKAKSRKVHVTLPKIESVKATSGADVYAENTLKTDAIRVIATSGADIRLDLDANEVDSSATSGSDINLSGTTKKHNSKATSGASIDAYDLRSETAVVAVTSGANINIHASESINAAATSGGDVDYSGNPKKVSKSTTSGGSVSKR